MNYNKIYNNIINNAKDRVSEGYVENHHIIPDSLGGSNDSTNMVKLTAREHFICHYLLTKIYDKETIEWYKMINAFMMMKCNSLYQDRYFNSRLYESKRIDFSNMMSIKQQGDGNSQFGSMWIHNLDLKLSKKIQKEDLPTWEQDGWLKGRKMKFRDKVFCKCGIEINAVRNTSGFCRSCRAKEPKSNETLTKIANKVSRVSESQVIEVLKESKTFDECMIKLGYNTKSRGGNTFNRIKRIAKENNIVL